MVKHIFTQEEIDTINKGYYEDQLSLKEICEKCGFGPKVLARYIKENNMSRPVIPSSLFIDETGNTYGRLIVIEKLDKKDSDGRNLFRCRCACGNEIETAGKRLRSGITRSCGCLQKEKALQTLKNKTKLGYTIGQDLTGQRFGKLVVIKEEEPIIKSNNKPVRQWLCHCDCGNDIIVQHVYLTTHDTQSCGCITSQGEANVERLLQENNILYVKQYRFKDFSSFLRFDFGILKEDNELSHLIEFDGEQHYDRLNGFFSEKQYNNDILKNQYCLKNNIPLIRIPYKEKDNLDLKLLYPETTKKEYLVSQADHYNCNMNQEKI